MSRSRAEPPQGGRAFTAYTREFVGAEGLAHASATGTTFSAKDPDRFRMRVTAAPLDRTRVIDMRVTPHRAFWNERTEQSIGGSVAFFQFILNGRAIGNIDGHTLNRTVGSIQLLHSGVPFHYVTDTPLQSVSLWVHEDLLSPTMSEALHRGVAIDLQNDASARGATAIIRSVLKAPPEPQSAAATAIESVLLNQLDTAAILAISAPGDAESEGLYSRLRAHLAADLGRTDRDAATVADELGVSQAALARALRAQRTTVTQLLRELRFDSLAEKLRDGSLTASMAELAQQAGFGGADQAARTFRERTGLTMSAYRRFVRI
jgi:AraC-like DNA-binding protein